MNVEGRNSSKSTNWPWILLLSFSKHCKSSYCLLGLDWNICLSWCSQNRCTIVNFLVAFAIPSSSSSDCVNNPDLCFFVCGWVFVVSIKSLLALLATVPAICKIPAAAWELILLSSRFLSLTAAYLVQCVWSHIWLTSTLLSDPGVNFPFPLFIPYLGGKVNVFE